MKKFIIVIVFVFLIAILISFNYLLWDREKQLENYQDLSNSKNLSIDTLGEKINNLDKVNRDLLNKVDSLTKDNTALRDSMTSLGEENLQLQRELSTKNSIIIMLKSNIDTQPFEEVIKKWVDALNAKNFKTAQALISKASKDENLVIIEKFKTAYQNDIKSIKLKSSEIYTEATDNEHLSKIQLKVKLEVDKQQPAQATNSNAEGVFKNGENEKYITMEYDQEAKEWRISEILDNP